ncbi:protein of unknown function [Candidatus Hydrogenisulfobacillus filiaventi]|uniref:Uncharacterized protein n=1 Tax=Candidatus Hydrogenisulfobacillus filiaventi TaxID=2707344 RepID=A0A6F8ZEX3_9FIRM|nr:protein of unknown function [Candidatus Hydrogenisulfobacillus filiaventi]
MTALLATLVAGGTLVLGPWRRLASLRPAPTWVNLPAAMGRRGRCFRASGWCGYPGARGRDGRPRTGRRVGAVRSLPPTMCRKPGDRWRRRRCRPLPAVPDRSAVRWGWR